MRAARGGLARVAAVGLGTGSLACHRRGNEPWTFFEIDPEVVRIARDPRLFSFLSACAPDAADRARRCAADARGVGAALRPDRARRLLVRRDPGASADPRGDRRLSVAARAGRRAGDAHLQPAHGARPGGGRGRRRRGARHLCSSRTTGRRSFQPTSRSNAIVAVLARDPADLGDLPQRRGLAARSSPIPALRPGPTTTPTSSARSCARSSTGERLGHPSGSAISLASRSTSWARRVWHESARSAEGRRGMAGPTS